MPTRPAFHEAPLPLFDADEATGLPLPGVRLPSYIRDHRQRLRARFMAGGAAAMPDYELLELVLFRAIPRQDAASSRDARSRDQLASIIGDGGCDGGASGACPFSWLRACAWMSPMSSKTFTNGRSPRPSRIRFACSSVTDS